MAGQFALEPPVQILGTSSVDFVVVKDGKPEKKISVHPFIILRSINRNPNLMAILGIEKNTFLNPINPLTLKVYLHPPEYFLICLKQIHLC